MTTKMNFLVFVFIVGLEQVTGDHHHKFGDPTEIRDEKHIKSHLEGQINTEKQINPEEMPFHYFKMYDLNNDGMLDGIELQKAMTHLDSGDPNNPAVPPQMTEQQLEETVDIILRTSDLDGDNQISYAEFLRSQSGGGGKR